MFLVFSLLVCIKKSLLNTEWIFFFTASFIFLICLFILTNNFIFSTLNYLSSSASIIFLSFVVLWILLVYLILLHNKFQELLDDTDIIVDGRGEELWLNIHESIYHKYTHWAFREEAFEQKHPIAKKHLKTLKCYLS